MKKLKNILQCDYVVYILLIISLIFTFFRLNINISYNYYTQTKNVIGYVRDYKVKEDKIIIYLRSKENLVVNYYFKNKKEISNISYGDCIKVYGVFDIPSNNSNFNLFNYRKYLLSKKIKYVVKTNKLEIVKKNYNIFYKTKNILLKRINKCKYSKSYIKTFLFADKNNIDNDMYENYQKLGVSHLFAISGMHVSFITMIFLKMLSFMKENKKYIIITIFLLLYLFFTDFAVSMARACFQFILFFINKILKTNIKNINLVILLFSLFLIYNPYYIYNVGFIFSFTISFSLLLFNKCLKKGGYLLKLFKVSLISFLVSTPIIINNFYQINLLSILLNLFYVPFVSFLLFPFSLLTLLFPFLDSINFFIINIFECISRSLSNINILVINTSKIPILLIILYYILVYSLINNITIKRIIYILLLFIAFIFCKSIVINPSVTYMDVGQGDSQIIRILNKNIMIDTGGIVNLDKRKSYNLTNNVLLPYLKSDGIKKIDYLILTHGDFDHMGEAINLVNNFKVEKVIFNCGEYNDLEKELIEVLDKKKIKYYSCIKELNIYNNKLYFLQTKEYDNENDNSNVIYTELNGYKFMFMGDASSITEKEILEKYNLPDIDVLKVGHHGSKTSSNKEFINEINPRISIISVGKNNRYGHPNKEALDNLEKSKIYRTDQDGSIMFKIKNKKLKIETCSP